MEPFLEKLAQHLLATYSNRFSRICLVFPSRRASLFFKQYVSQQIGQPVWLPDIYALEDFVSVHSGLRMSDPLDLIAKLYKVYKSLAKEKAQLFPEFISWGNMLLADFDEIDQYLADGEKVFQYLDEIKAIKSWNPDGQPLTAFEQDYLRFYNSLAPCYSGFRSELIQNGEAYFGLAFEMLLKDISQQSFDAYEKIIFAGFNALTASEEKLFKFLLDKDKAEIYWDADQYYLDDSRQEAGHFLREYIAKNTFGKLNWIGDMLGTSAKNISVIGVPGNVGQAKLAGQLLKEVVAKKGNSNGVALVLVDEGLLLPVLNSIPAETGDFNVTMGFPLKQTPVFSLINSVITLFANAHRFAQPLPGAVPAGGAMPRFYYKDLHRFFSHPYMNTIIQEKGIDSVNKEGARIEKSFYFPADLLRLLQKLNAGLAAVFMPFLGAKPAEAITIIDLVKGIVTFLAERFAPDTASKGADKNLPASIELEYLFHAAELCSKLDIILKDPEIKPDFETIQTIVSNLIAGKRLPFYGEPLNGLQVMGMLETRMLDFTDIIMISVNEGLLPKGKHQNTFIPEEVRMHFGMQRYSERTAVFGYHFYRLLQRAENAWLIYNTEGDELGGGEKSRFIAQLLYELPKVNPLVKISEQTLSVVPGNTDTAAIEIQKTPQIMQRLHQVAERGLSPTALAMYLRCSLQFYFAQVLRISEPEQISETIDAATLGEIVHEALQHTYEAEKGGLISAEKLEGMIPEALSNVDKVFSSKYSNEELSTGRNLLIVQIARNIVKRFLEAEKQHLLQNNTSIEILMLEEPLNSFVEIEDEVTGGKLKVKIHGKADRIDRVGGVTRIIDYKTGRVNTAELKADQISNLREKEEPAKLLQVLAYALMYVDMQPDTPLNLISGIVSLRSASAYLLPTLIAQSNTLSKEILTEFREELTAIVKEIYSTAETFRQTDQRETCKICVFKGICNRSVN